jgi:hypothetical protein
MEKISQQKQSGDQRQAEGKEFSQQEQTSVSTIVVQRQRALQEMMEKGAGTQEGLQLKSLINNSSLVRKGATLQKKADRSPTVQKGVHLQQEISQSPYMVAQRK